MSYPQSASILSHVWSNRSVLQPPSHPEGTRPRPTRPLAPTSNSIEHRPRSVANPQIQASSFPRHQPRHKVESDLSHSPRLPMWTGRDGSAPALRLHPCPLSTGPTPGYEPSTSPHAPPRVAISSRPLPPPYPVENRRRFRTRPYQAIWTCASSTHPVSISTSISPCRNVPFPVADACWTLKSYETLATFSRRSTASHNTCSFPPAAAPNVTTLTSPTMMAFPISPRLNRTAIPVAPTPL